MSPVVRFVLILGAAVAVVAIISKVVRDRIAAAERINAQALAEEARARRAAERAAKGPGGLLGTGILGSEGILGIEGFPIL